MSESTTALNVDPGSPAAAAGPLPAAKAVQQAGAAAGPDQNGAENATLPAAAGSAAVGEAAEPAGVAAAAAVEKKAPAVGGKPKPLIDNKKKVDARKKSLKRL